MHPAKPQLSRLGDLLSEWELDAEAAHQALVNKQPRGPVTGFPKLDRELGGALQPGMHIIHGGPGVGKTAFTLQLAACCGFPALYVTAEMSRLELFKRHTARATETFLGRLKSGEFRPIDSLALAREAAAAAPLLSIADATRAPASLSWLLEAAEIVRGESPHLLVIIDSIHSWSAALGGDQAEYEVLNAGLRTLHALASAVACPVLGVAERNRASMQAGGLSASAGSRRFEYGSESLMELDRRKDGPPDTSGEVDVELRLAKNRSGVAGRVIDLRFHGALQRFREA